MPAPQSVPRPGATATLTVATALVTLLLCEAVLAALDYPPRLTEDQRLFVEYDSVRGWRNVPDGGGRYVTSEYDVPVEYNERGYRGPLHPYEKGAGTYRVLLLGDSFLEGYTVALKNRVAEVVEASLRGTHPPGGVEVIALGTAGYSTDQELLWLESEGLQYRPDLVILLFVDNDYWYNNRDSYPRGPKPLFRVVGDSLVLTNVPVPHLVSTGASPGTSYSPLIAAKLFLTRHSRLYRLAKRAIRQSPRLQALGARLGLVEAPTETVKPKTGQGPMPAELGIFADPRSPAADSAYGMTARLLARMDRDVRAAAGAFTVLHVPVNQALYPPGAPQSARYRRPDPFGNPARAGVLFAGLCRMAAVACVDPTARFLGAAESLATRDKLLVYPVDEHWNEEGHRVAAEVITDIVRAALDSGRSR